MVFLTHWTEMFSADSAIRDYSVTGYVRCVYINIQGVKITDFLCRQLRIHGFCGRKIGWEDSYHFPVVVKKAGKVTDFLYCKGVLMTSEWTFGR